MTRLFAVALLFIAAPVRADDNTAYQLADLLASEEPCGMQYSPTAIKRFIADNVPDDDLEFTSDVSTFTRGHAAFIEEMSTSSKIAHCAQAERAARRLGFVP